MGLLDSQELARYDRYTAVEAARTFLGCRILVRSVLSCYWPIPPHEWRFSANEWGRPEIANEGVPRGLTFNLSNKPGYIVCLVGYDRQLGVDVEDTSMPRRHLLDLAGRYFSLPEARNLALLPPECRLSRFYEFWTLKESYIKARGRGLSLGLSGFTFEILEDAVHILFSEQFDDQCPERWNFRFDRTVPGYLIATAAESRTDGERPEVEVLNAEDVVRDVLSSEQLTRREARN